MCWAAPRGGPGDGGRHRGARVVAGQRGRGDRPASASPSRDVGGIAQLGRRRAPARVRVPGRGDYERAADRARWGRGGRSTGAAARVDPWRYPGDGPSIWVGSASDACRRNVALARVRRPPLMTHSWPGRCVSRPGNSAARAAALEIRPPRSSSASSSDRASACSCASAARGSAWHCSQFRHRRRGRRGDPGRPDTSWLIASRLPAQGRARPRQRPHPRLAQVRGLAAGGRAAARSPTSSSQRERETHWPPPAGWAYHAGGRW